MSALSIIAQDLFSLTPFYYPYRAYSAATCGHEPVNPLVKRAFETSPSIKSVLNALNPLHKKVGDQLKPFFKQEGITNDLVIEERPCISPTSVGSNWFSYAAIWIPPLFSDKEPEATKYLVKEQVYYIKANTMVVNPLIVSVISAASFIFSSTIMANLPAFLLTCAVAYVADKIMSYMSQTSAIDYAIKNSTNNELIAGKTVYLCMKRIYNETNTSHGIFEPSHDSTLEKFDAEMSRRNLKGIIINLDGVLSIFKELANCRTKIAELVEKEYA